MDDEMRADLTNELCNHVCVQTPLWDDQKIKCVQILGQEIDIRAANGFEQCNVLEPMTTTHGTLQDETATYLLMETRKATIVTTSVKISTMDHLAKKSSHERTLPRVFTETILVGVNQSPSVMICFV